MLTPVTKHPFFLPESKLVPMGIARNSSNMIATDAIVVAKHVPPNVSRSGLPCQRPINGSSCPHALVAIRETSPNRRSSRKSHIRHTAHKSNANTVEGVTHAKLGITNSIRNSVMNLRAVSSFRPASTSLRNYRNLSSFPPSIRPVPSVVNTSPGTPDISVPTGSWRLSPVNSSRESINSSSTSIGNHDSASRGVPNPNVPGGRYHNSAREIEAYNKARVSYSNMAVDIAHPENSSEVARHVPNYAADKCMGKIAKCLASPPTTGLRHANSAVPNPNIDNRGPTYGKSITGVPNGHSAVAECHTNVGRDHDWSQVHMRYFIVFFPLNKC